MSRRVQKKSKWPRKLVIGSSILRQSIVTYSCGINSIPFWGKEPHKPEFARSFVRLNFLLIRQSCVGTTFFRQKSYFAVWFSVWENESVEHWNYWNFHKVGDIWYSTMQMAVQIFFHSMYNEFRVKFDQNLPFVSTGITRLAAWKNRNFQFLGIGQ